MLYRIRLPLKVYYSPFYQVCFLLEHHVVDKFARILFSCQILIRFLGNLMYTVRFTPIQRRFLICGPPEVTWG